MSRNIRALSVFVLCMFLALFVSTTTIQVFQRENLQANPYNSRSILAGYEVQRGAILLRDGTAIAHSVPVDSEFKYQRVYADGPLYSAVTGYYTYSKGSTGIEQAMNPELSGRSDAQFLSGLGQLFTGQDPAGASVQLSIDPAVQRVAWDALGEMKGAVVAMDPATGEIAAMVSKPSFDPSALTGQDQEQVLEVYNALLSDPEQPLQNRAIGGDMNPPGSVFKLVIAAAALEYGVTTPDGPLPNPPTFTLPGSTAVVNNPVHGAPCGEGETTTLRQAIQDSCNVPFAQLAITLGDTRVREMAEKLGFNHEFSIPTTASASNYPEESLDDAQTALTGFGQFDVRATPLQISLVSSAIANGGIVMNPTLVDQVIAADLQQLTGGDGSQFGRAFSEQTARALQEMMVGSVSSGVASNARIDGVDVAGKTGTAENGEDEPYSLWFTGFIASGDRHLVVTVVLEDGGGEGQSGTGNGLAATIAQQVMKAVLDQ
ncbi:MAG: penicillin-binding transpeptidase domain-containing protein [Pseudoclavibacter sp.]|nr:penicillin-binding transpeptidase domain-containing protein [Pseudoclavibacter sp.]